LDSTGADLLLTLGVSFILFFGGLQLSFRVLNRVAVGVGLLAVPGVVITAFVTGTVAYVVFDIPYSTGLLIGAVLAPTDPAILIPLFDRIGIRQKIEQTAIAESALNDATGAVLALVLAGVVQSGDASIADPVVDFLTDLGISTVLGIGFGMAQPIFTLVIQNAAPREYMGAATASSQFFRSIGSTIGVAIFGTVLLTTYHRGLESAIPPGTPDAVTHLFDNPLEMARTQSRVADAMAATPGGSELLPVLMAATRDSLDAGMHLIFAVAAAVIGLTLMLALLLPELPLRKAAPRPAPAEG